MNHFAAIYVNDSCKSCGEYTTHKSRVCMPCRKFKCARCGKITIWSDTPEDKCKKCLKRKADHLGNVTYKNMYD